MVIIDEKVLPPPPYAFGSSAPSQLPSSRHHPANISTFPPNLLLTIIYMTFPQTPHVSDGASDLHRETCYWLAFQLRFVNRAFYIACMHILRSIYLPAYQSEIRSPYTSDPFPMSSTTVSTQRETQVFDNFIVLKAREDFFTDASELHLGREELFKDIFDLMQPRSRLEDLVRDYGYPEGVVLIDAPSAQTVALVSNQSSSGLSSMMQRGSAIRKRGLTPIRFSALSVSFSPRKVRLVLSKMRTVVEVIRCPDQELEVTAAALVKLLKHWLREGNHTG